MASRPGTPARLATSKSAPFFVGRFRAKQEIIGAMTAQDPHHRLRRLDRAFAAGPDLIKGLECPELNRIRSERSKLRKSISHHLARATAAEAARAATAGWIAIATAAAKVEMEQSQ
eukprot:TRINITY_DN31038_c0_g1_i1.p1 TRINITY_DN31038_c0_g1~~TRINITY_DN31038_c0_g1_i1.p1  ORF type:complete len:134 (+),score=25.07 TRINITY_DN31038_c0_g1_i1:57-404(+)